MTSTQCTSRPRQAACCAPVARRAFPGAFVVALVAGTVLNYVVGVAMFCALTQSTLAAGITACVLPFIPTAIIKAILASVVGFAVRKRLN